MYQPTHPAWRELYRHLMAHMPKGVRWHPPLPPYYTGYEQGTLYDWDQYFEAILQVYAGYPCDYIKNGVRIFLSTQKDDGFIARSASPAQWAGFNFKHLDMVKPFLAQNVVLCYQQERTLDWLVHDDLYDKLVKYIDCWTGKYGRRGEGLSVWRHAGHTGMDNHYERAGEIDKSVGNEPLYCEGVDLNSYLVRDLRSMAVIAAGLDKSADAKRFAEQADAKAQAMRAHLWNDDEKIFYDRHAETGEPIRIKYVGTFAALWANVATAQQAKYLVDDHLLNEAEFWRPWPIPALAASEPTYIEGFLPGESTNCCSWRGNTWVPTNYYTFAGLRNYGFDDVASQLADKTLALFDRGKFNEYYTSESGSGTGRKPFWGWTGLALFMGVEQGLDVDPTRIADENDAGRMVRDWIVHQVG